MTYLLDTNILLRLRQTTHPQHSNALKAVLFLKKKQETLCIFPQNLMGFWVVATRPMEVNGLGLNFQQALQEIQLLKTFFILYEDKPSIFQQWEILIVKYQVMGKKAHDTRLVAGMIIHQVNYILTFNINDFKNYSEITAVEPLKILENE
ncbi:MAG: type II toxin-antitoxin system VapC family toxin [Okeania sp. SIO3B5]|uniref:type II toxin-antitoxin system VapC family toxin n=1 Tax=Okeania sp. SIO3B5 TaxID=2607811 RepID=UPI0013FE7D57|nr:type II toxin-antitoxin system VapC family toxin [Okeania sp. SIO3B5]NEO54026.1 type II toxin-antitoxin system VapC family toxin [Okeania sp. SIO3B5]